MHGAELSPLGLLNVGAILAVVLWVPGWAAARALAIHADLFAHVWLSLALTSMVGLVLALTGAFSLVTLLGTLAGVAALAGVLRGRASRAAVAGADRGAGGAIVTSVRGVRVVACAAGAAMTLWCWPPFETVIAASDSTMYVNAGIHLARTGALSVHDSVVALIWPFTAREVFPSVTWSGFGPYIRLPGGLLMANLFTTEAIPAFFPLLSVWAAIVTAAGGPTAAPAVAPILMGLAVWSVVLCAGETLGVAAAAATALFLLANFACWWFGRFAMSEPLACAFIWGGLVFLARATAGGGRGAAFAGGAMLGLAGLARTETFLFVAAAGALWLVWFRARPPAAVPLAGFVVLLVFAAAAVGRAPSHHLGYLTNEGRLNLLAQFPRLARWRSDGTLAGASGALAAILLAAGLVGHRFGVGFLNGVLRASILLVLVAATVIYAKLGGNVHVLRHLGWLATYCSWPLLTLALAGGIVVWRRGGPVLRLGVLLWFVTSAFFLLNPRVAAYQPWAIRRFLPVVIPGLAIAAGAAVAVIGTMRARAAATAALAAALGLAALEVRPILAVYARPYFAGSFANVERLAERFPPNAIVAIDSGFADLQFQVPLWLVHGRETLMLRGGGTRWQEVMRSLLLGGRPVFWVANHFGPPPSAPGLTFLAVGPDLDLTVPLPDGPADTPPGRTVERLVPFKIYEVAAGGNALAAGDTVLASRDGSFP